MASPSAFDRRPAATDASMRFFRACLSAFESALGETPSCLAASLTTAWLSDDERSWVAAIAPPPPATTAAAATPATNLRFRLASMSVLLSVVHGRGAHFK